MTRAETASLTLALHVLRRSLAGRMFPDGAARGGLDNARHVLDIGYSGDDGACEAIVGPLLDADSGWERPPTRILRARLALFLRATLRAERGDCGGRRCPEHGCRVQIDTRDDGTPEWWCPRERTWHAGTGYTRRLAAPLWTLAPEHRP